MQREAVIWRIIGNEMPPRDLPGSRIQALRHILENEAKLIGAERAWFLNRILDDDYRRQVTDLLDEHSQPYFSVPFDRTLEPTVDNMRGPGININAARNLAISLGHALSPWCVVLDGDCFFETAKDWEAVLIAMREGQFKYLSIPSNRMGSDVLGESMLAFHYRSDLRFNQSLRFGDSEKLELLFRLGHDSTPDTNHLRVYGNLTKVVGKVVHYSTGSSEVEGRIVPRLDARTESIKQLAARLNAIQRQQSIG